MTVALPDGGLRCVALCQPAETHASQTADAGGTAPLSCAARGAPSAECHFFWQLELERSGPDASVSANANAWGFCSDPAFMFTPRCVTLDAGDHRAHGCAPR